MALGIGQGVRIGYTTTASAPYTWNRIKEITEFAPPEINYDEVDITSHDTNGWKRSIPGLKEVGDVEFSFLYDDADTIHTGLYSLYTNRTIARWAFEIPESTANKFTRYEFKAWVKAYKLEAPMDDKKTVSITLKFSDVDVDRQTNQDSVFGA